MSEINKFLNERKLRISNYSNSNLDKLSKEWLQLSLAEKYQYNFDWLGRPIIQYPNDILAIQEIVYKVQPDLIIETGIAHGGSLILSASLLAILDIQNSIANKKTYDPSKSKRKVLGIDIDIRSHNKIEIEKHPMFNYIEMLEGSSTDSDIFQIVKKYSEKYNNVLLFLDSNHTHQHVLDELNLYAQLVTKDSYCVVFDTFCEDMPEGLIKDRPWGPGNSGKTATAEFLKNNSSFIYDKLIENKLLITSSPNGFLKKIK